MPKFIIAVLLIFGLALQVKAQELNCEVTINTEQLQQATDKRLFREMRNQIFNYMNNTRWTNDVYKKDERINCKLFITITNMPEIGTFKATVQVISSRPVYGTGYETVVFSNIDKDWAFEFNDAQPLQYSPNAFTSNLASLLSFYAYTVIGMDMDTYALNGGSRMYDAAVTVMNNVTAQGNNNPGWKAFEGTRNRYWVVNNLQDPQMTALRNALYTYHIQGLDIYVTEPDKARANVLTALRGIQKVARIKPGAAMIRDFFDAKSEEVANMLKGAAPADKQAAITLLSEIDPTNTGRYQTIMK